MDKASLVLCVLGCISAALAFTPFPISSTWPRRLDLRPSVTHPVISHHCKQWHVRLSSSDPLEDLDEDRKANLFQCLLRDLQIEGVPLLECDADQASTLQAALWTTMAELSEQDEAQKVCLVLESIGVEALMTFVDDFLILKTQSRLMDHLPELERFSIGVVGKRAGPAIVIETSKTLKSANPPATLDEFKVNASMRSFVDRFIAGQEVCPYTKNANRAPEGLENVDIQPSQIGYRYCGFSEACHVLSSFWNCICEMLFVPDDELGSIVLTMPALSSTDDSSDSDSTSSHDGFAATAELISRSLCLYRGDDVFEILHFHPLYDRNKIYPNDQPAHGHLPPISWLRSMLQQNGNQAESDSLSDSDLELSNYQRRAPFPAVVIKRVSHFEALAGSANEIVDLELEDGQVQKASGVPCYARNAIKIAKEGEASLRDALAAEITK